MAGRNSYRTVTASIYFNGKFAPDVVVGPFGPRIERWGVRH